MKCASGSGYRREPPNRALAKELRTILSTPQAGLLVGIPTLAPHGPKYPWWVRHQSRFLKYLAPGMEYGSAFISRPDSAPAIECLAYCEMVQQCWAGKDVVVVAEPTSKLVTAAQLTARTLVHIPCPSHQTYAILPELEPLVLAAQPEIVLLSHGVSATCFAARLTRHGIQALDLGSIGGLLCRWLLKEPTHAL